MNLNKVRMDFQEYRKNRANGKAKYFSQLSLVMFGVIILFFVNSKDINGQVTKVMGTVTDSITKQPLPFVNVYIKGTAIGVTTGFDGNYSLESRLVSDVLIASFIGYKQGIKQIVRGKFQTINFSLLPDDVQLSEVVIRPGENPAEIILRKIIEKKAENNREKYDAYQYEAYTKIQFDANNISEKFRNRKIFKPFQFVFDNLDTSSVNGKAYLPIFLSESLSDVYFRKNPRDQKEVIKATRISGIQNESMSQFVGDLIQNLNIYDNYLLLFQKNFVSPVANIGLAYYKYYLVDSTFLEGKWCYNIVFKPRRVQELTFTGNFWVNDTSFAVKKMDMKIAGDANINFINDLVISQEFEKIGNRNWMLVKDKMIADFNVIEDSRVTMGFFGTKTTTYRNFEFEETKDRKIYALPTNIVVLENSIHKDDNFWQQARHEELSKDERTIFHMIDTLKTLPVFNTYVNVIKMITTGYWVKGNFEVGPYMSLLSFNYLEGTRLRFGGRTSNDFSTKIMFEGYGAYGTLDKKMKYSGGFLYMIDKNPRRALSASFKYDIEQLGLSQNAFREDFLLAGLFSKNTTNSLSMVKQYKCSYEHEWFSGLSNTILFSDRILLPTNKKGITIYNDITNDTSILSKITTSEIALNTRFAYKEKVIMGEFERTSLGGKYPVLDILYGYGIKDFLNSDYEYSRLQIRVQHWFNLSTFGWSKYSIEAGQIWGKLPFPLLKIHSGNETYWYDESAFNLMYYYEFVSDKYLSFLYAHHFDGLFLNKIPLMRKLKWREQAQIRGVVGSLASKNSKYTVLPPGSYSLSKPYFEAGAGIENIFKIIRVDAIWRLSYLNHERASKFGVFVSLQFDF
ncbi:MAG: DUF5686 family protein [Bacteroidales bacterium]